MILPSWNDWKLTYYGGPLAITLVKKNLMVAKKMELMREYFVNEFGVFKIDSLMQYHHGKQAIFFFNAHDTKFGKILAKKVRKLYLKHKDSHVLEILHERFDYTKEKNDLFEAFELIVKESDHYPIDLDTDKYLPFFRARSPKGTKLLMELANKGRKEIDSLYPTLKPPMNIVAIMIGLFVFVILYQDIPKWLDQASGTLRGLMGG